MIGNENVAKSSNIFICNLCNYKTDKKFNYDKHILTRKHLKSINGNEFVEKNSEKIYECEMCNKNYKDLSGLWRHKKKFQSHFFKRKTWIYSIMLTFNFFIIFDFKKSEKYFGKSKMDILKCPKSTFPKKSWKFHFFSLSYFEILIFLEWSFLLKK